MSVQESCCFEKLVTDECHTNRWRNVVRCFHKIEDIAKEDLETIISRVPNSRNIELISICDYHFKAYLTYYTSKKKCFDPWNKHSQAITQRLSKVDLELSNNAYNCLEINLPVSQELCRECFKKLKSEIEIFVNKFKYCINPFEKRCHNQIITDLSYLEKSSVDFLKNSISLEVSISHKICITCNNQLKSLILKELQNIKQIEVVDISEENSESQNESEKLSLEKKETSGSDFITTSQSKRQLDSFLSTFGLPPFKRQKMNDKAVINTGVAIVQNVVDKVSDAFEDANDVKLPDLKLKQALDYNSWFNQMISNLQTKFNDISTTYDEKVSLLTLLPKEWSLDQINQYFDCNYYMVTESQKLRETKGKIKVF